MPVQSKIKLFVPLMLCLFFSQISFAKLKLNAGDVKPLLVIMVNTTQSKFTKPADSIYNWIFPTTSNRFTIQDWIKENFAGQVSITPSDESYGTVKDGVVLVNIDIDDATALAKMEVACKQAILIADRYVDFSHYDPAHTGKIDASQLEICFLFAIPRYFGCATSFAWGAAPAPVLDGVSVDYFEIIAQEPSRDNIGAMIHDWLHLNGEDDFYANDGSRFGVYQLHLGYIWVGDSPNRKNPSHIMPICSENFGFINPQTITESGQYELSAWTTGNYNYLKIPTIDPKQYFLVENRQFDGFDSCLAKDIHQPGIVIYHIDRSMETPQNFDNTNREHRLVTIEAANESKYGYNEYNVVGDGILNTDHNVLWHENQVFGPSTVPNSKLYGGKTSDVSIKVTSGNGPIMKVTITMPPGSSTSVSPRDKQTTPPLVSIDVNSFGRIVLSGLSRAPHTKLTIADLRGRVIVQQNITTGSVVSHSFAKGIYFYTVKYGKEVLNGRVHIH